MSAPLKTFIPLNYFYQQSLFDQEVQSLFRPHWTFVGFVDQVVDEDQYITANYFGDPVVIKNFRGVPRAFLNVCSHRFSQICSGTGGKGALQCPYHGWTYNEKGEPYAIPRRKSFPSDLNPSELRLKAFELETVGRFMFIRDGAGMSLKAFLGETYSFLEKISIAMGRQIDENPMVIKANWKIVVENTLEEYHVRQVHPTSLYKVEIQQSEFTFQDPHSADHMTFRVKFADFKKLPELMEAREWHIEDYVHQFVFPNLTIASAFGTSIAIQKIEPLSANETRFTSYVFAAKLPENELHPLVKAFNSQAVQFNRQVFQEDLVACEAVQVGIQKAHLAQGTLSQDEERVWRFEKNYMQAMGAIE